MSGPNQRWKFAATDLLRYALGFLAAFVFLSGLLFSGLLLAQLPAEPTSRNGAVLTAAVLLVGSLVVAGLLVACSAALRLLIMQIREHQHGVEQLRSTILLLEEHLHSAPATEAASSAASPASAPSPAGSSAAGGGRRLGQSGEGGEPQVLELLEQLRDLSLMDTRQRNEAARRHWEKRKETLVGQVDRAIDMGQWEQAGGLIQELATVAPDDPTTSQLAAKLTHERTARLRQDVEAARRQIQHLTAITAWRQAEEIVASLRQRYAGAAEISVLGEEVQRERQAFEMDHIRRLMLDLKDATERRQWRRAVSLAEEIINRYPREKTAELLRLDLPTLRENADAQERREEENLFKDLLHRQRYEEALATAHRVIAKYPSSPTAIEMNKLLPKVEEFKRQEDLRRTAATANASSAG